MASTSSTNGFDQGRLDFLVAACDRKVAALQELDRQITPDDGKYNEVEVAELLFFRKEKLHARRAMRDWRYTLQPPTDPADMEDAEMGVMLHPKFAYTTYKLKIEKSEDKNPGIYRYMLRRARWDKWQRQLRSLQQAIKKELKKELSNVKVEHFMAALAVQASVQNM